MKDILAIDIGGSSIKYALMDCQRHFLEKGKVVAPREAEKEFICAIVNLYEKYKDRIDAIGISMAAKLDKESGLIISSGAFPFLQGKSLIGLLKPYCPVNITVRNDGHCAGLAEMYFGSLVGAKNGLVIVLGTGIGSAIILNNQIYEGSRHCSGELSVLRTGNESGLKHSWMFNGGGAVGLMNIVKKYLNTDKEINGIEIFELADQGNESVLRAIDEYCRISAIQIYNLQAIFDVETIAIGGGISSQDRIIDGIRENVESMLKAEAKYGLPVTMPNIVHCKYGNEANLLGAWYDAMSRKK